MEEVRCPRCDSSGEIPSASGQGTTKCFVCGGGGYIDKQDLEWKSQWASTATPEPKAVKPTRKRAGAAAEKPVKEKAPRAKTTTTKVSSRSAAKPIELRGRTPLHMETSDGNLKQVCQLLEDGADPNARDDDGRTPLHWPSLRGHIEVVQALLEHGADVNARDNEGRTPLRMATIGNRAEIVELLREHGGEL